MKTIIISIIVFLFSLVGVGQDLNALDKKYGFRDARLETPVDSFNNLELLGTNMDGFPGLELYSVPDADLIIGDYTLDNISYWFFKGKLMMIEITVSSGSENQNGVLKVLEAAYGKGEESKSVNGSDAYNWDSGNVSMSYTMGYDSDPTGDIQITSINIFTDYKENELQIEEQKNQKIQDAAKNL